MTTVHAYTGDQQLVDGLHKDPRRARAAAMNIVPTTTGAARATGLVLPAVEERLDGLALRVPVPDGSITDLVAHVASKVTVAHVLDAYREAAGGPLGLVLELADEPLVSSDLNHVDASATVALPLTQVVDGRLLRVLAWYDNEWGFSTRMADVALVMAKA